MSWRRTEHYELRPAGVLHAGHTGTDLDAALRGDFASARHDLAGLDAVLREELDLARVGPAQRVGMDLEADPRLFVALSTGGGGHRAHTQHQFSQQ